MFHVHVKFKPDYVSILITNNVCNIIMSLVQNSWRKYNWFLNTIKKTMHVYACAFYLIIISFQIYCFYDLWTRIYEYGAAQLSIFHVPWL